MKNVVISVVLLAFCILINSCEKNVTDFDDNVYEIVKIGKQRWLAEDLRATSYNDGSIIPMMTVDSIWANLKTGAFCYQGNNKSSKEGLLYNWYAVSSTDSKNICPTGWHVPSDNEWTILTTYLGGEEVAGKKLKIQGTNGWKTAGGTNETGFSAVGGLYRSSTGKFEPQWGDIVGVWWSCTENEDNVSEAWCRNMSFTSSRCERHPNSKNEGFKIRCIKD